MNRVTEAVLRRFGDDGAEMFARYFAQIEYTAFWCSRMLDPKEQISIVVPDTIDDVLIMRGNTVELHQVKTRAETQPPWTTAEVLESMHNKEVNMV